MRAAPAHAEPVVVMASTVAAPARDEPAVADEEHGVARVEDAVSAVYELLLARGHGADGRAGRRHSQGSQLVTSLSGGFAPGGHVENARTQPQRMGDMVLQLREYIGVE